MLRPYFIPSDPSVSVIFLITNSGSFGRQPISCLVCALWTHPPQHSLSVSTLPLPTLCPPQRSSEPSTLPSLKQDLFPHEAHF